MWRSDGSQSALAERSLTVGINRVVAVADYDWFEQLYQQPNLSEVNFCAPSAANFQALQPGELFLFKLHPPRNVIVCGGRPCVSCHPSGAPA